MVALFLLPRRGRLEDGSQSVGLKRRVGAQTWILSRGPGRKLEEEGSSAATAPVHPGTERRKVPSLHRNTDLHELPDPILAL
jgi:hypothetical protein